MWVALKPNLGRGLTFISHISGRTRANIMKGRWTGGNRFHKRIFLVIFLNHTIAENLMSLSKQLMGQKMYFHCDEKNFFGNIDWEHFCQGDLMNGLRIYYFFFFILFLFIHNTLSA